MPVPVRLAWTMTSPCLASDCPTSCFWTRSCPPPRASPSLRKQFALSVCLFLCIIIHVAALLSIRVKDTGGEGAKERPRERKTNVLESERERNKECEIENRQGDKRRERTKKHIHWAIMHHKKAGEKAAKFVIFGFCSILSLCERDNLLLFHSLRFFPLPCVCLLGASVFLLTSGLVSAAFTVTPTGVFGISQDGLAMQRHDCDH